MIKEAPEIKELSERRVACVSYKGNFVGKPQVFKRLFRLLGQWAKPKGLIPSELVFLASYADDPETTPLDKLRLDACMTIPESTDVDDANVHEKMLPSGTYTVMRAELAGPPEYEPAWNAVVEWVEQHHYEMDRTRPCYEVYLNNPDEYPEKH